MDHDSLANVTQSDITEVYKELLQLQENNHSFYFTLLFGFVTLLIGITWWWNRDGARNYIKQEVDKSVISSISAQMDNFREEFKRQLADDLTVNMEVFLKKMLMVELNTLRSLAYTLQLQKNYANSVTWWAEALSVAIRLEEGIYIRSFTKEILVELKQLAAENKMQVYKIETLHEVTAKLPDALIIERNEIKDLLKSFTGRLPPDRTP